MIFSPRSVAGVSTLQSLALLPPVVVSGLPAPDRIGLVLAVAALTSIVWEMIFAGIRKRDLTAHGITTALIVTLFCPPDIAPWQLAFAVSLGVVLGELIFGGRGFGFVSPAALALSLLMVSFPDSVLQATTQQVALAVLPGLALLLAAGLVSLSVFLGVGAGVVFTLLVSAQAIEPVAMVTALSIGAVFLIADPTAASITAAGRWFYGLLAGGLVVIFSQAGGLTPEAIVAAALFTSVFAPLIDHGVVLLHIWTRRSHG